MRYVAATGCQLLLDWRVIDGTHPDISGGFPAPELTAQRLGVPRPISLDVGFLLDVRPHELLEGLGLETD
jgi:hypothetical protein